MADSSNTPPAPESGSNFVVKVIGWIICAAVLGPILFVVVVPYLRKDNPAPPTLSPAEANYNQYAKAIAPLVESQDKLSTDLYNASQKIPPADELTALTKRAADDAAKAQAIASPSGEMNDMKKAVDDRSATLLTIAKGLEAFAAGDQEQKETIVKAFGKHEECIARLVAAKKTYFEIFGLK